MMTILENETLNLGGLFQTGRVAGSMVAFTEAHQIPNLTMTIHEEAGCEEPLCLISNLAPDEQPRLICDKRYWVETLFGNCKSRGFQLARTHMTTPAHLDRSDLGV